MNDHSVTVVCYYEHDDTMVARFEKNGIRVILLEEKRDGLKGLCHLLLRLMRIFRAERPQVVHGVYFAPGMIPLLAARLACVPNVFATIHAAGRHGYNWKARLLFRISAMLTTHFFCVAENTERFWFGNIGGKRHSTIHNGVDIEYFTNAAPAIINGISPNDRVIGIVGRIVRMKGHECLFHAIKPLLNEIKEIKILVVGDGPNRPYLEKIADILGIAQHIIWSGWVEPEKLPGYYKRMDVLVMPSQWEGFGLSAAEAMASGVPVIGSDVPGLREVIGDAGILFPVDDKKALYDALKKTIHEHDKWVNYALRRIQQFSLSLQQQKWRVQYKCLLTDQT